MNIKSTVQPQRHHFFFIACLLLFALFSQVSVSAPKNIALDFWSDSVESNTSIIDHGAWQSLLNTYLDDKHPSGVNRFNYAAVSSDDRSLLSDYLQQMQKLDPRDFSGAEQKAYWINLYNAITVDIILKGYPVESITTLGKSFFNFGPWDDKVANIQELGLSLNEIEHGILRPLFHDNRIHYAVNCASFSCPNLSATAYTAANTHRQLEQAAHEYVNHPRGVTFENAKLKVSSIYSWYKEDFGNTDEALISHLIQYADPPLAQQLRNYQGGIEDHYNWDLNQP